MTPLALLARARGRGRGRYVLTVYAPVNGYQFERMAVIRGRLPFVQTALDRLPTFATYEGTQQVERLLNEPEQSELPAVTKQQVPVGRRDAPLSVLARLGTNQYVAKVYRRLRRGLELRCEAIGPDHYARAALDRADVLMTDAGKEEVQRFFNNYNANQKRQAKRRTARKQVQP